MWYTSISLSLHTTLFTQYSYRSMWHSQVAVVVQGLADLLGHRLIHLHDRCLVPAAVAVVGGTEDRAHSLHEKQNEGKAKTIQ